jgi:uncharacterized protein (DUF885 family)
MKILFRLFLFCAAVCISIPPSAQTSAASSNTAAFDRLVDDYFDFSFQHNPTQGTAAGFHQYDHQLEDFSRAGLESEIAGLEKYLARLQQFPKSQLPEFAAGDLDFLSSQIRAELLELQ